MSLGEVLDPTPTFWTHGSVGEAKAAEGGVEITKGFGAALQTLGLSLKARGATEEL